MAAALLVVVPATSSAASLTLEWDAPTDGITAGYFVWWGASAGAYTGRANVGFATKYRVDNLADNTRYCFAVQAYDSRGTVSEMSAALCTTTSTSTTTSPTPSPTPTPAPTPSPTPTPTTTADEIVLYASFSQARAGHWSAASTTTAAGGQAMRSTDQGWSSVNAALAAPPHYVDYRFEAVANKPYRLWLRLRAGANSKWNDSVWVQFSDARAGGKPVYEIGSTSALMVNLERCSACGVAGWGWLNSAYWLAQTSTVTFAESGTHTIRVQTREDGVEIDQIVLSAARFASASPGAMLNDATILPRLMPAPIARTPYSGTPIALPGTIDAAHFDQGSAGVAYADSSIGNTGGSLRMTDVDLQPASDGGVNIGWIAPGEWVTYTVNVTRAAAYTAQLRVASMGGGSVEISAGAPSNVTRTISIPNTGAWQTWTTVSAPVTLAAGTQTITIRFLTANVNLRSITVR